MQVTVSKEDKNISTIEIETEAGRAQKAYEQTLRLLSQNLNLPGFRKGKVPLKMVIEHYGSDFIKQQTLSQDLLSELLFEAFKQEGLDVLFIPAIERVIFEDPADTVKITAKVELFPEVKLPEYQNQEIEVEIPEMSFDKQYADVLQTFQKRFKTSTESSEPAAISDEIIFDFEGEVNTGTAETPQWEAREGMSASQYQATIEPGRFIDNFLEQIVGMKPTETKTIEVRFPDDYHADLAGKNARFKITLHQVLKPQLPEITDELAQKMGFENLEAVKHKTQEELDKVSAKIKKNALSEIVMKTLEESSEIEFAEQMIEREIQAHFQRIIAANNFSAKELEELKANMDLDKERALAKSNLKRSFIISSVIKKNRIEVSEEELVEAFTELYHNKDFRPDESNLKAIKKELESQILSQKAIDKLAEAFKVTFKTHVHSADCHHH